MHDLSHVKTALVVENNYLIAIDIRAALLRCGCYSVEVASSISESGERVALGGIDLVTLGIQFEDGDCGPVAKALLQQRIPFVYVSGFQRQDYPDLPDAPWVEKPALDKDLCAASMEALQKFSQA